MKLGEMKIGKNEGYYILIMGILYLVYGILQVYNGLASSWIPWLPGNLQLGIPILGTYIPNTFPDFFSGLVLLTVGAILVKAVNLRSGSKAYGFLFVGWLMAVILLTLNILIVSADILDAYYPLLWGGDVAGWSLAEDPWGIGPHLVLGLLLLPLYPKMKGILEGLSSTMYKGSLKKRESGR